MSREEMEKESNSKSQTKKGRNLNLKNLHQLKIQRKWRRLNGWLNKMHWWDKIHSSFLLSAKPIFESFEVWHFVAKFQITNQCRWGTAAGSLINQQIKTLMDALVWDKVTKKFISPLRCLTILDDVRKTNDNDSFIALRNYNCHPSLIIQIIQIKTLKWILTVINRHPWFQKAKINSEKCSSTTLFFHRITQKQIMTVLYIIVTHVIRFLYPICGL